MSTLAAVPRPRIATRDPQLAFHAVCALLLVASMAAAVIWCTAMSSMRGTPMPGGWTLSGAWTAVSGRTWLHASASFLGMWTVMMTGMMLPSVLPLLWRYRQSLVGTDSARANALVLLMGAGYFFVWTVLGTAVYGLGVALAAAEVRLPALSRAVPAATGWILVGAGALQFTRWKLRHLACCRELTLCGDPPPYARAVWRQGLRLGRHCCACCAGLTSVLLAIGVMELRAMALVMAAITAERLAPAGERLARIIGILTAGIGLLVIARSVSLV